MKEKIITLTTNTYQHTNLLQSILEAEGIECFLENVNVIDGSVNMSVKIRIKESDLERAMSIMESIEEPGIEKFVEQTREETQRPRILLPIDFSDYSDKAADMALDWAMLMGAEILVLNVFFNPVISSLPFSDSYIYESNMDKMMLDMEEEASKNMKKFMLDFKNKRSRAGGDDVKIKKKLISGVAEEEILRLSLKYNPTVIIMGTRGKDRKAADLIGSVTSEVMDKARVPVMAVPEDFDYKGIDKISNILYATTFDESDFIALEKLDKLVKPLNVKIFFVHIGFSGTKKWDKLKLEGLKKYVEEQFAQTNVECDFIESEDFWVGLEGYIQKKNIDIISLITRRRNLVARLINPSVGKKMLFHTNTPILMFHA